MAGAPPTTISRYEIVRPIGQGGMGTLYLAWDPKLARQLAIKLLKEDDLELRERFAREARSAAGLRHPHIVTIFDVGDHGGQPFIAMEYIQGVTLATVIREWKPLTIARKVELIEELCDGLAYAHGAGIVHRDIKPANLIVSAEGQLKILDFGIARLVQSTGMTQAGQVVGTLNYMSPEQMLGRDVDHRSDIFAVGVVLYELLSHRQAFPGGLGDGVFHRILNEKPDSLAQAHHLDPEIVRIVDRAIEKRPEDRYQDLATMRSELRRVRGRLHAADDSTQLMAAAAAPPIQSASRRDWRVVAGLALLAIAAVLIYVWSRPALPPLDAALVEPTTPAADATAVPKIAAPPPVQDAPPPQPQPQKPATQKPAGTAPRSPSTECVKLIERESLGEELTAKERAFLQSRCRLESSAGLSR